MCLHAVPRVQVRSLLVCGVSCLPSIPKGQRPLRLQGSRVALYRVGAPGWVRASWSKQVGAPWARWGLPGAGGGSLSRWGPWAVLSVGGPSAIEAFADISHRWANFKLKLQTVLMF